MCFGWADGEPRKWTLFDKRNLEHSDWAQAVANLLEGGANGLWEETSGRLAFCPAPFFSDVQFAHLEINLDDQCLTALFSLVKGNTRWQASSFDFSGAEIHRLNTDCGLHGICHELDYIEYFLTIVRSEDGAPFRLLHFWIRERMEETLEHVTQGLGQLLSEELARFPTLRLDNIHKDGAPVYVAPLLYSGRIFISWLKLDPNGMVTMLEDNPLDFGEHEALRLAVAEHLVEIGGDTTGKSDA